MCPRSLPSHERNRLNNTTCWIFSEFNPNLNKRHGCCVGVHGFYTRFQLWLLPRETMDRMRPLRARSHAYQPQVSVAGPDCNMRSTVIVNRHVLGCLTTAWGCTTQACNWCIIGTPLWLACNADQVTKCRTSLMFKEMVKAFYVELDYNVFLLEYRMATNDVCINHNHIFIILHFRITVILWKRKKRRRRETATQTPRAVRMNPLHRNVNEGSNQVPSLFRPFVQLLKNKVKSTINKKGWCLKSVRFP